MSPNFVMCLLASGLAGVAAATLAVFGGWGVLPVLLAYSFVSSTALVATSAVVLPGAPEPVHPSAAAAGRTIGADEHALA